MVNNEILDEKRVPKMWNRRPELNFLLPVTHHFRHTNPAMANLEIPQVPAWAKANKPRESQIIRIFDERLGTPLNLAGENLSVAGITAMFATDFMKPARLVLHFKRWYAQAASHPSNEA